MKITTKLLTLLLTLGCLLCQNARAVYDPTSGRFVSFDPLGHGASMDGYSFCGGDPVNHVDPDGRQFFVPSPAFSGSQYVNNEAFTQGMFKGERLAFAGGVGSIAAFGGAELATPALARLGASTAVTTFGAGAIGGAIGNATTQGFELLTRDRNAFSGSELTASIIFGGGISYGVNRVIAPRLLLNQLGNAEIGALGEQQAAQDIIQSGGTISGRQVQFRTPDGNPKADFVVPDSSSPSGFKVIEIKTGNADLTDAQAGGYPHVEGGNAVPIGSASEAAGLPLGQALAPTPVGLWNYQPYELLPFGARNGGALGAAAGSYLQQGSTGKCGK